jgi:hypothetical protein
MRRSASASRRLTSKLSSGQNAVPTLRATRLQDFGAHQRVDLHLLEFFRSQASGLVDDVFGNRQLADVVQQGGRAQRFDFVFRKTQFLRDLNREYAHALQVPVRGMVLGFDGKREALDGPQVQRGSLFGVAFFDGPSEGDSGVRGMN